MDSSASWGDVTVAQAGTGKTIPLPRGRAIGGSSTINAMVFARGHRSSYDAWVAQGAKGWGFADLLPFFRKSERAVGRDPSTRGTDGPMVVAPATPPHQMSAAFLEAASQAGHCQATDISGGLEEGFGYTDLTIVGGVRQSAADAYLWPSLRRGNLDVVADALVYRLRIEDGRCVGVDYRGRGGSISVNCSSEVVLAAGAIGSAQLLLLSGIGPQAHLRQVGVDVVLDLPGVGANLHDHPGATVAYAAPVSIPIGVGNRVEAAGLMRGCPATDAPDLQALFIAPLGDPAGADNRYAVMFSAMTPYSRGSVRLASAQPDVLPLVDPNYLGDPRDVEIMIAGLRFAREIGNQRALSRWRFAEVAPGPIITDAGAVRAYLRANCRAYWHPVGTCRIGADETAVVDTDLCVHGISGLRVADASVMPSIPSANTNATVLAIAERAATLIQP